MLLASSFAAACATGPAARPGASAPARGGEAVPATRHEPRRAGGPAEAPLPAPPSKGARHGGVAAFPATTASLRSEIARRAEELKSGPIGNRATQLASLRLAASGRDLLESGSNGGAITVLERAVSLDAGNGYACLWLALAMHLEGRDDRAVALAGQAGRLLPQARPIRAELDALQATVRSAAAK